MAAGIEAARTFFICACLRARCWPRLTNLYFPLRQQSYDLLAEAARLETFMHDPVNVLKSSLRPAWRSRATGTDRCRARLAHSCVCPALVRSCWRRSAGSSDARWSRGVSRVDVPITRGALLGCYGS